MNFHTDVCPPIMPAVAAAETCTSHAKIKHNRIHLPQPNSALMLAWIGQTWQCKVIDYLLGFFPSASLQNEGENVTLPLYLSLFHNTVDLLWKMLGCEGNLCVFAAACSQTRCSLWCTLSEELWAHRHFPQHRTWHNAYKRHGAHLFEVGSFSSMIFKWLLTRTLWILI